MLLLGTLMSGLVIGISLMTALVFFFRACQPKCRFAPLFFTLTFSGYVLTHGPAIAPFPDPVMVVLVFITGLLPFSMTLNVHFLLLDHSTPSPSWIIGSLCILPTCVLAHFYPDYSWLKYIALITFYLALLLLALRSWYEDLVKRRRDFKRTLFVVIAISCVLFIVAEFVLGSDYLSAGLYLLQQMFFAILFAHFGIWILDTHPGTLSEEPETAVHDKTRETADPQDAWIIEKVHNAMEAGLWRREGLTITALASELGVPEYRLRETINKGLGYRNFPAFINGYRIGAARDALADPERTGESILQIAYDSGFASLGPFNRAFRQVTGQSPSEFRKSTRANTSPIV